MSENEHTARGPAGLIPQSVLDPFLHLRDAETLERLALLAEGHKKIDDEENQR